MQHREEDYPAVRLALRHEEDRRGELLKCGGYHAHPQPCEGLPRSSLSQRILLRTGSTGAVIKAA